METKREYNAQFLPKLKTSREVYVYGNERIFETKTIF